MHYKTCQVCWRCLKWQRFFCEGNGQILSESMRIYSLGRERERDREQRSGSAMGKVCTLRMVCLGAGSLWPAIVHPLTLNLEEGNRKQTQFLSPIKHTQTSHNLSSAHPRVLRAFSSTVNSLKSWILFLKLDFNLLQVSKHTEQKLEQREREKERQREQLLCHVGVSLQSKRQRVQKWEKKKDC